MADSKFLYLVLFVRIKRDPPVLTEETTAPKWVKSVTRNRMTSDRKRTTQDTREKLFLGVQCISPRISPHRPCIPCKKESSPCDACARGVLHSGCHTVSRGLNGACASLVAFWGEKGPREVKVGEMFLCLVRYILRWFHSKMLPHILSHIHLVSHGLIGRILVCVVGWKHVPIHPPSPTHMPTHAHITTMCPLQCPIHMITCRPIWPRVHHLVTCAPSDHVYTICPRVDHLTTCTPSVHVYMHHLEQSTQVRRNCALHSTLLQCCYCSNTNHAENWPCINTLPHCVPR